MKVQFGCGGNILDGFKNHDLDVDVTILPLPYMDSSVEFILVEHLTEHLDSREAVLFLGECHRILTHEGTLRVCCPVIGQWMDRGQAIDLAINHGHRMVLNETSMRDLIWMAGFRPDRIKRTDRWDIDGHHKIIGKQKDDEETCRLYAVK